MISILYICTHNRCRSILSEAITNELGKGRLRAYSAGSSPSGQVHPLSIHYLEENGFPTYGLQSQSWDDFEDVAIDVVITVCDQAAQETCPVWFGNQLKLHWGLQDPSKVNGSEHDIALAFHECIAQIKNRVSSMLELDTDDIDTFSRQLKDLRDNS